MTESPLPRVLIVDDSRMVRASIAKHLKDHYDIREEGDGESAWQTLVLDHTIRAVISDLSMPVMDGFALLARIRDAKTAHLRQLPVIMISGEEDENSRNKALSLGANDFITKGIGTAELLARVESLVRLGQAEQALEGQKELQMRDAHSGLFSLSYLQTQAEQVLSLAIRQHAPMSVLVLGFDALEHYTAQYGRALVDKLQEHFARLLGGNMRKEDSLGHYTDATFAIVSPGTPVAASEAFARRLQAAVAAANIAVRGQRLPLTISIGVASYPGDSAQSAAALLALAEARRASAAAAGGNRWVGPAAVPPQPSAAEAGGTVSIDHALALLAAGRDEELRPQAAALARALMPLLSFLNYELEYQPSAVRSGSPSPQEKESQGGHPGGDAP